MAARTPLRRKDADARLASPLPLGSGILRRAPWRVLVDVTVDADINR
jgi:hypothetical protein